MLKRLLTRRRTLDRDVGQTPIHVVEQLGPKRALTPEGFLLCQDVPISRVGTMLYGPGETPIKAGEDGIAYVSRSAAELFSPETIASFNGKPVVDEHPDDDVTPGNWNRLSIGITLNPRQGTGQDSDVLLADLLITQKAAIRDVQAGKREVSAGYSADYRQTGPGRGEQSAIIGNHVALVEKGRCGPRCAIGDHSVLEEQTMGTRTITLPRRALTAKNPVALAVRRAFRDAETAALEELGETPLPGEEDVGAAGDTHIHIHGGSDAEPQEEVKPTADPNPDPKVADEGDPSEARFQALEQGHQQILAQIGQLAEVVNKLAGGAPAASADEQTAAPAGADDPNKAADEAPAEEEKEKEKAMTGDSAALETSFRALVADAEILVPGFKVPTFDAKQPRKATMDSMCAMRRRLLDHVALTTDGAATLAGLVDGPLDLSKQTCQEAAILFKAAVAAKRQQNNGAATRDAGKIPGDAAEQSGGIPRTPEELNKFNREYWAKQQS